MKKTILQPLRVLDTKTGEFFDVEQTLAECPDLGFEKIWTKKLLNCINIKSAKMKIVEYILCNRNRNDNGVIFTLDEIKEKTGVGKTYASSHIKELIKDDFITRGKTRSHYFVNPDLIWRGQPTTRVQALNIYRKYKKINEARKQ